MIVRKQIGSICSFFSGYTPSEDELFPSGVYPYFKVAEMNRAGNQVVMIETDSYLRTAKKFFPRCSIVFPKNGAAISTNKKRILGQDSIVDLNTAGVIASEDLSYKYLYYIFQSIDFKDYVRRGAVPTLDIKAIKGKEVQVPSLEEQQHIVAELDLLTGIIDKKNAQLHDLDALTQSIFYEMFGDPIANENGWRFCALKDVSDIVGGSTPKTNIEEYWGGTYNWVTPAELHGERYQGSTERKISDLAVEKTNLTLLPVGTVLLSSRAPIGKVAITTEPMYCNQGFKNLICSESLNNEYVCQALKCKTEYLQSLGTGATFKEISKKTTENIKIAVPPIALQTEFAKKVVAIEAQKRIVCESLIDSQSLFDSKMSYYFE